MKAPALVVGIVTVMALCAGVARSTPADPEAKEKETRVLTRDAIVQLGVPRSRHAALDSIPHPSPGVATLCSLGGIVVPALLLVHAGQPESGGAAKFAAGAALLVAGPAAGYVYGGIPGKAVPGVALRLVGATALMAGVFAWAPYDGNDSTGEEAAVALFGTLGGAVMVCGSALWDLASVSRDVEAANLTLLQRTSLEARPLRGGAPAAALTVRF